jgi:uncharacterized protein YjeT (DUF2065 family)
LVVIKNEKKYGWMHFRAGTILSNSTMRRLNGNELGVLLIASVFIICGAVLLIHPTEMTMVHQEYKRLRASFEHVSEEESQVYGAVAIILGSGLVWMVFYGRRK